MNYDQKVRNYRLLNDEEYQRVVDREADLGYSVVSTTKGDKTLTIAYKRNKNLKYYNRLKDLETKIEEIELMQVENLDDMDEVLDNKGLITQKFLNVILTIFWVIYDIYIVLATIAGNSDALDLIIAYVIAIAGHALLYMWHRKIKKKSDTDIHLETNENFKEQLKSLREKAKNISKEER